MLGRDRSFDFIGQVIVVIVTIIIFPVHLRIYIVWYTFITRRINQLINNINTNNIKPIKSLIT